MIAPAIRIFLLGYSRFVALRQTNTDVPPPDYKPGQFLTFSLALPAAAGATARLLTRCYSLSDSPSSNYYRVTIKRVVASADTAIGPAGAASNFFHDYVHAGYTLKIHAPSGRFYLDAASFTPVVLIAGGIGITPMMSMLRWCSQHQPQRVVHLFYGVRNSAEHAYKAALQEMALMLPQLRLHVVYSKPLADDRESLDFRHQGRVDMDLLKRTLPLGKHQFYICGPAAMMESLVPGLDAWGVASNDIHVEAFGPASFHLPKLQTAVPGTELDKQIPVHFQRSGRALTWTGKEENLLDFAEAHGIPIESGCRSGSCGSCVSTLVSGVVDYERPPDYDLEPGQCLLCVGTPREALTLDA